MMEPWTLSWALECRSLFLRRPFMRDTPPPASTHFKNVCLIEIPQEEADREDLDLLRWTRMEDTLSQAASCMFKLEGYVGKPTPNSSVITLWAMSTNLDCRTEAMEVFLKDSLPTNISKSRTMGTTPTPWYSGLIRRFLPSYPLSTRRRSFLRLIKGWTPWRVITTF